MSRFAHPTRRLFGGGIKGLALALCAVGAGYAIVTQSLAVVLTEQAPELAHQLAPGNGRVSGAWARKMLENDVADNQGGVTQLAERALLQDATAVAAVGTLGLVAQLNGNAARAARLFEYAARLTRRDLPTELWLIEDAVRQGNIPGALRHYDIALRTQPGAGEILFPVLATASTDPAIALSLTKTLQKKPLWSESFITYLAINTKSPVQTAGLFQQLSASGVPVATTSRNILVDRLLGAKPEAAWAFYRSFHPDADRHRSNDPYFTGSADSPSQLDWVSINDEGLSGTIQRGADRGLFAFSTAPTVGGVVLRQRLVLPPGSYRIEGESIDLRPAANAWPYWALSCMADGRELGQVAVPPSENGRGRFAGLVTVTNGCAVQQLAFTIRPSESVEGVTGQLSYVALRPVQGSNAASDASGGARPK